jgi:hypothetical protein
MLYLICEMSKANSGLAMTAFESSTSVAILSEYKIKVPMNVKGSPRDAITRADAMVQTPDAPARAYDIRNCGRWRVRWLMKTAVEILVSPMDQTKGFLALVHWRGYGQDGIH